LKKLKKKRKNYLRRGQTDVYYAFKHRNKLPHAPATYFYTSDCRLYSTIHTRTRESIDIHGFESSRFNDLDANGANASLIAERQQQLAQLALQRSTTVYIDEMQTPA